MVDPENRPSEPADRLGSTDPTDVSGQSDHSTPSKLSEPSGAARHTDDVDSPSGIAEQRVRQALNDAVADVEADHRLNALVDERRAEARATRPIRPWLVAAVLLLVVGVVGTLIVVDRNNDTTKDIDRVATEPPAPTTTTTSDTSTTVAERFRGWGSMSPSPIGARTANNATSVWTGSELIVWGEAGSTAPEADNRSGAAYDPATDAWRTIAPSPVQAFNSHSVWTGTEMFVGPAVPDASDTPEGYVGLVYAAYDPDAESWRVLPTGVDDTNGYPVAWTGTEVLLDGGVYGQPALTAMDPVTGDRRDVPAPHAPLGDLQDRPVGGTTYVAMDDGQIAAISSYQSSVNSLAISNQDLTAWTEVPATGIAPNTLGFEMVWTGTELVSAFPGGAAYDPASGTWRQIATRPGQGPTDTTVPTKPPPPDPASPWMGMSTVFTGRYLLSEAGVYEPATDRWVDVDLDVPDLRVDPLVAWDGTKVLIWSGGRECEYVDDACTTPDGELFPADGLTFQP